MCQFNCSLFAFIFKAVAARWVDWRLNLADSKENKKIKAVQRETCYLSATVGPRLGFKLCCWMVYVANSITNQYTVGRGEAAVVGLCRVGRAFFIIYNCAAQTEHFRIGREREKGLCVLQLRWDSFLLCPPLSLWNIEAQKKKQGQPDSFLFFSFFIRVLRCGCFLSSTFFALFIGLDTFPIGYVIPPSRDARCRCFDGSIPATASQPPPRTGFAPFFPYSINLFFRFGADSIEWTILQAKMAALFVLM